jgi:hypothetical protein
VERPFRYIREDFFLARSFRNLADLNQQLRHWLDTVANPRVHATTRRVVNEAFAEERQHLRPLPLAPFRAVLRLERRISREGMVSVGGNFYSVPDATRRRTVEVHTLAEEIRIFEDGALLAAHPVLEGRHQRRIAPGHRTVATEARRRTNNKAPVLARTGDLITPRPLEFYDAVGRRLARESRP